MRVLGLLVLVAAVACGPFGGRTAPPANRVQTPLPGRPAPAGPAGVLLELASSSTYSVSLVFPDGRVEGPVTARLRTLPPPDTAGSQVIPVLSASDSRVYYLDGDNEVRFLGRDGSRGLAARIPGGARSQSAFAVSPDNRRIAVATLDYSDNRMTTRLSVADVAGGGNRVDVLTASGGPVWPVGWHANGVVVAVGSAPTRNLAANPYGTFSGYQLLDATTGVRRAAIDCDPAGTLTAAGTACLDGGRTVTVQDFSGQVTAMGSGASSALVSADEAPDGGRVAFCCAAGQLQVWNVVTGAVAPVPGQPDQPYGWIDAGHLLVGGGGAGQRAQIVDVTTGASIPVEAHGQLVARLPGGL